MDPLVSIVISAYQAEAHLAAALDSAVRQTYRRREIIAVNDGSVDGTAAILERFRQTHGILVFTQPNRGQCAALNEGLRHARGDYIKFFDSDDLLSPDMLAIQVAALNGRADRLAYGEWSRFRVDPQEAVFALRPGWHDGEPRDWLVETWRDTEPMYQCGLWLIPAALLRRTGGWDERLSLINDFEFFTRLVAACRGIVFTPGARLYYRSGLPGSLSDLKSRKGIESAFLSLRLAAGHLLALEDSPRVRQVIADNWQSYIYGFYPAAPDLMRAADAEVGRLGGSALKPGGGRVFDLLTRWFGWRASLWLRRKLRRYRR